MSEDLLALVVTIAILAALFLWVPTLHLCNERCQRLLLRRRNGAQAKNSHASRDVNQPA